MTSRVLGDRRAPSTRLGECRPKPAITRPSQSVLNLQGRSHSPRISPANTLRHKRDKFPRTRPSLTPPFVLIGKEHREVPREARAACGGEALYPCLLGYCATLAQSPKGGVEDGRVRGIYALMRRSLRICEEETRGVASTRRLDRL